MSSFDYAVWIIAVLTILITLYGIAFQHEKPEHPEDEDEQKFISLVKYYQELRYEALTSAF